MRIVVVILLAISFFYSCSDVPDGYAQTQSGLTYKFLTIGDGDLPEEDDYTRFAYTIKTENDSVIFSSRMLVHLIKALKNGELEEGLFMMNEGAKVEYILSPKEFYAVYMHEKVPSILRNSKAKVEIEMIDIQSDLEYQKKKNEFLNKIKNAQMDTSAATEIARISAFINENQMPVKVSKSGLAYFFLKDVNNDKKVAYGKTLYLHYRGKFFDGREFNSTFLKEAPQDLVYGQEMQVLQGIEEALLMMNEGDKMGLVIPSHLAFGEKGSSTGLVPPNTPVYYEIELVTVN